MGHFIKHKVCVFTKNGEAKPAITDYLLTYKYELLTFGDRIPRYVRIDSEDQPCLLRNDAAPLLPYFLFVSRENPREKKTRGKITALYDVGTKW